jgi:hypothetical protein
MELETMKKLKIYLDTSVISHLSAPDVPEKMKDTIKLWKDVKNGVYDVVISENECCSEPKRSFMYSSLANVEYIEVQHTKESERLANLYFKIGDLPLSSKDDANHIAIASVHSCNIITSWNFKHIVNLRAMTAVDVVNLKEGYAPLRILSPSMLLNGEE